MIKIERLLMVEVEPPKSSDMSSLIKIAHELKEKNVTSMVFSDSPCSIPRADPILTAVKIKEESGIDVVPHLCCRDKNVVALRSLLLGAHANGIRNMLLLTGNSVPVNKSQAIKPVFNCNSISLMELAADLNRFELRKNPLRYGGVVNYDIEHLDIEIKRVKAKMESGALFFASQPVYTPEDVAKVREIALVTKANIYCTIMPLVSRKNADFVRDKVMGVHVPDSLVEKFSPDMSIEEGEAVGLANAKEMLACIDDFTYGYYFNFPFNRTYLLDQLLPLLNR